MALWPLVSRLGGNRFLLKSRLVVSGSSSPRTPHQVRSCALSWGSELSSTCWSAGRRGRAAWPAEAARL